MNQQVRRWRRHHEWALKQLAQWRGTTPPPALNSGRRGPPSLRELYLSYEWRRLQRTPHRRRPTAATTNEIWTRLAISVPLKQLLPISLPANPPSDLPPLHEELTLWARQAVVVALDTAVLARRRGRMLTQNLLFDALAERWSENFRQARRKTGVSQVRDMSIAIAEHCRRDLVRIVQFETLWHLITGPWSAETGQNPLFHVERVPHGGYTVELREGTPELVEFEDLLEADPAYRRSVRSRVLLAREPTPPRRIQRKITAGWEYDKIPLNDRAERLLRLQESVRLYLNVAAFLEDVCRLEEEQWSRGQAIKLQYGIDVTKLSNYRPERLQKSPLANQQQQRPKRLWTKREQAVFEEARKRYPDPRVKTKPRRKTQKLTAKQREWCRPIWPLLEEYDSARSHLDTVKKIANQLRAMNPRPERLAIKSGFFRGANMRWYPSHFWPTEVTTKDVRTDPLPRAKSEERHTVANGRSSHRLGIPVLETATSRRGRWFMSDATEHEFDDRYEGFVDDWAGPIRPLFGLDVSSSQIQLLAIFLGLDELEQLAGVRGPISFKEILAAQALKLHREKKITLAEGYDNDGIDPRLQRAVKKLVMTTLYGSTVRKQVTEQRREPAEYGPGWAPDVKPTSGTFAAYKRAQAKWKRRAAKNAQQFLDAFPWFQGVNQFLRACRRIAFVVHRRDPYAGVTFTDPFDGVEFRWNPVKRQGRNEEYELSSNGLKLRLSLPKSEPNSNGDYVVNKSELRRRIAPCLTHMLDACFSGIVMEELAKRGVRNFVAIHDCWLVPTSAEPALYEALEAAGEPWLRSLGPVYDRLVHYLDDWDPDRKFADDAHRWRAQWAARVKDQKWPRFAATPERLFEMQARQ